MVTTRSTAPTVTDLPPPAPGKDGGYERFREERIRENLERMQKLGIADLALRLKAEQVLTPRRRSPKGGACGRRDSTPRRSSSAREDGFDARRSSRLQTASPVSYMEVGTENVVKKKLRGRSVEVISRDEVYTEEHEKLLGTCEEPWTLFVDGCGADGKRIYNPFTGKTCHQCRQKTLGHRTSCSRCEIVQGQFCGDCLYMRYGENVLEAENNPDWICPVCRGICNCSICRVKKGWAPTGALYRKVCQLGYKSVAHYLIQTRRGQKNSEYSNPKEPVSARKSLPFVDDKSSSQSTNSVVLENVKPEPPADTNQNDSEDVMNDSVVNSTTPQCEIDEAQSKINIDTILRVPCSAELTPEKLPSQSSNSLVLETAKQEVVEETANSNDCVNGVKECEGDKLENMNMNEAASNGSENLDSFKLVSSKTADLEAPQAKIDVPQDAKLESTNGNHDLCNGETIGNASGSNADNIVLQSQEEQLEKAITVDAMGPCSDLEVDKVEKRPREESDLPDKENSSNNYTLTVVLTPMSSHNKRRKKVKDLSTTYKPSPDCIAGRLRRRQSVS